MSFDQAWSEALEITFARGGPFSTRGIYGMKRASREDWLRALLATRREWEAAYNGASTKCAQTFGKAVAA